MNGEFAKRLTLIRKEKGISQKQAAEDLGVSQALLSHYEKGIRECGLAFLTKAAAYYGVSADYLLGLSQLRRAETESAPRAEEKGGTGDLVLGLGRKITQSSADLLYEIAAKAGNRAFNMALNNYLYLSIYKAFRLLYAANPKNQAGLFGVDPLRAPYYADAALAEQTAEMAAALVSAGEDAPKLGQIALEEEYPGRASSILNLVRNAETLLKK